MATRRSSLSPPKEHGKGFVDEGARDRESNNQELPDRAVDEVHHLSRADDRHEATHRDAEQSDATAGLCPDHGQDDEKQPDHDQVRPDQILGVDEKVQHVVRVLVFGPVSKGGHRVVPEVGQVMGLQLIGHRVLDAEDEHHEAAEEQQDHAHTASFAACSKPVEQVVQASTHSRVSKQF